MGEIWERNNFYNLINVFHRVHQGRIFFRASRSTFFSSSFSFSLSSLLSIVRLAHIYCWYLCYYVYVANSFLTSYNLHFQKSYYFVHLVPEVCAVLSIHSYKHSHSSQLKLVPEESSSPNLLAIYPTSTRLLSIPSSSCCLKGASVSFISSLTSVTISILSSPVFYPHSLHGQWIMRLRINEAAVGLKLIFNISVLNYQIRIFIAWAMSMF